jgi:hypothetical protein
MPKIRYEFTAETENDWDIIEWIDGFSEEEKNIVIKSAIREGQQSFEEQENLTNVKNLAEKVTGMEEILSEILRQLVDLRKSGIAVSQAKQPDKAKKDIGDYDTSKADENLSKLFG